MTSEQRAPTPVDDLAERFWDAVLELNPTTATFYGDQALFVRRTAFAGVGGFPLRLAEDIAISEALRAKAPPAFLPLAVVTSARKFEQMGVWTSFARVLAILLCLRFGRKPPAAFFADIR